MKLLKHVLLTATNSPKALLGTYLTLIFVSALLFWSFEENKSFGDAIWWAVVTASTVGYGDLYPNSAAGRFLAGGLISVMVLLVIPLITAHFASKLIVDNDAFKHEEQEEIKSQLRAIRAILDERSASADHDAKRE